MFRPEQQFINNQMRDVIIIARIEAGRIKFLAWLIRWLVPSGCADKLCPEQAAQTRLFRQCWKLSVCIFGQQ